MIYLIGSLRNPAIPAIAQQIRDSGHDVFDQWHAAGPEADKWWQEHFQKKGYDLRQALMMDFPKTAFEFDKKHLDRCDVAVLVLPAGRSGHLELGYVIGAGKRGYILMDGEPDRYDLMYGFATLLYSVEDLIDELNTPRDQLHEVGSTTSGLCDAYPYLRASCACALCERSRGDR